MSEAVARHGEADRHPALAHHFEGLPEQKEAANLGMWLFLAQEVMFFGGLFACYTIYRNLYPGAFAAGSAHLNWKRFQELLRDFPLQLLKLNAE